MPKPVAWSYSAHEIREAVKRSSQQKWIRRDIEDTFKVSTRTAHALMRAIGGVENIRNVLYQVDREELIAFLDHVIAAEDLTGAVRTRREEATPVARPKPLMHAVPEEFKNVMVSDLPKSIKIRRGFIGVRGGSADEVVERLCILVQALENDLATARDVLEPPRPAVKPHDSELRAMFANLEALQKRKAAASLPQEGVSNPKGQSAG